MSSSVSPIKISAFVISYNRQDMIRACLASLHFADEIILVDKSSTDRTVELAGDLADRIHVVPWSPTVEETRSLAASLCSHEWIAFLDDDECLNPRAIEFILNEVVNPAADAYRLPRNEHILGLHSRDAYYWPEHHLRFFRRGAVEFGSTVHDGVEIASQSVVTVPVESDVAIEHFSHANVAQWIEKANRYTSSPDRLRMGDGSEDVIAFAHDSIDRWVARGHTSEPGGYPAAVALLRATYDMIDRLKSWEEDKAIDGPGNFLKASRELEALYPQLPSWRARTRIAEIAGETVETSRAEMLAQAHDESEQARARADVGAADVRPNQDDAEWRACKAEILCRSAEARLALALDERRDLLRQLEKNARRPLRTLSYFLLFHLLKALAAISRPVSERRAKRFLRSAAKRDPRRFRALMEDSRAPFEGELLPGGAFVQDETPPPESRLLRQRTYALATVDAAAIRFDKAGSAPEVSIVIPTYGQVDYTLNCLKSLADAPPKVPFEILVAEDASGDPRVAELRGIEGVTLLENPVNLGFLRSCNAAVAQARGAYVFLLNNDTIVAPGAIDRLVAFARERPEVGLVGARLVYPDGRQQEAGGIVWSDGSAWNYGRLDNPDRPEYNYVREADYISGAAILIPRVVWDRLSGFDEHYLPAYCEDSDFAFRVRALGKKVFYHPFAEVCHFEGISHGTDIGAGVKAHQVENSRKLYERWREVLLAQNYPHGEHILRARDRARHGKIILIVDHYIPEPDRDAGSRTMTSFVKALIADGWSVKFWPENKLFSPVYTPKLQMLGVETFYGPFETDLAHWLEANGEELDCVLLSRPDVAQKSLPAVRAFTTCPVVYYGHDLHFARMRMQAEQSGPAPVLEKDIGQRDETMKRIAEMEALERDIWRRSDVVLYPSQEEADAVLALCPEAKARAVLPYCFESFVRREAAPAGRTVVFVAGFGHPPNVDAALWFVSSVWPLVKARVPVASLQLVGSKPTEEVRALASDDIEVTGWVSDEELRRRYDAARVAVVPLRFGAGVKLKVVEALMEGAPLVTTGVGAQGLPGLADIVEIADAPEAFAEAVIRLLAGDSAAWIARSRRQTDYCEAHFSQEALRKSLRDAIGPVGRVDRPTETAPLAPVGGSA